MARDSDVLLRITIGLRWEQIYCEILIFKQGQNFFAANEDCLSQWRLSKSFKMTEIIAVGDIYFARSLR